MRTVSTVAKHTQLALLSRRLALCACLDGNHETRTRPRHEAYFEGLETPHETAARATAAAEEVFTSAEAGAFGLGKLSG